MPRKLSLRVSAADGGLRLDQFLARAARGELGTTLSRRRARKLISAGAAYVDGRRTKIASRSLRPGQRVDLWVGLSAERGPPASGPPASGPPERTDADVESLILHEDEHLLAVDKPSGLPVQATLDDDRLHLLALLRRYFDSERPRERAELALPHRLDRGTSGVQLVAKTRPCNAGLAEAFRDRRVGKKYLALCRASTPFPDHWTVENFLEMRSGGPGRPRRAVVVDDAASSDRARFAETSFQVRARYPGAVLVTAEPRTGRTHQIRVHLAHSGHAVLGDPRYGEARSAPRLMLHAERLRFEHPVTGAGLCVDSPLPGDFRQALERLRSFDA